MLQQQNVKRYTWEEFKQEQHLLGNKSSDTPPAPVAAPAPPPIPDRTQEGGDANIVNDSRAAQGSQAGNVAAAQASVQAAQQSVLTGNISSNSTTDKKKAVLGS